VLEVSEQTCHRWRKKYGGMKADEAKRLEELEQENGRLKKLVADLSLDVQMLKEIRAGKLLSPSRKRAAVTHLEAEFEVSERYACEVVEQPRSTQRYEPHEADDEATGERMLELVRVHPRFGYRRIWALLRREGFVVNRKRVWRLWNKRD